MKISKFIIVILVIFTIITILLNLEKNMEENNKATNETELNFENEIIYVNDNILITNYDIDGRAEEVNLINEYSFLSGILDKNNAEISRQIKIYQRDYKGQKREEYSKFQENTIIYKIKNDDENFIEMNFSENKLLGDCLHTLEESYKDSIIEDEIVQIFKYPNPENQNNVTGLAYFTINGMNFRIKGYNISHENFIKIIKTTIDTYKRSWIREKMKSGI